METHYKIIGATLVGLALVHVIFPRYFDWKNDLRPLQSINRQMMVIHTFFIALAVLLMGLLCLTSAAALVSTPLGKTVSLGMGIFWGCRWAVQFWGYSSDLWRGKVFETAVHVAFSVLWGYLTVVFLYVALK